MATLPSEAIESWDYEPEPDPPGMNDDDFLSLLQREEEQASSWRSSTLADEQANALEFYDAEPFGDEIEGQSQVVVPYVAEVVDYMTISVARTCVSGDNVVEFEPREGGQEDMAAEATEAVSNAFMRQQDGYKVIIGWLQSGLIEKIGIVKTACINKTRLSRSVVSADEMQLAMLDQEGSLLDYSEDGQGGYLARTQRKKQSKQYVDMTVPSEEFLFSAWARHEDEAMYLAQRSRKTRSDLIAMDFDRGLIDQLSTDTNTPWFDDPRAVARWGDDVNVVAHSDDRQEFVLLEEYIRADRDGDGIAELRQVFRVGDTILEEMEVDEQPFVAFCPFPRAHRMVGDSLAEKVMDLQRLRSVTTRQTVDGMALSNRPRVYMDQSTIGETTINDWLEAGPGIVVRGNGPNGPMPIGDGFDIGQGLSMLQFLAGEGESRTGITRLNQGLDADTLNKTATGTALMQASGQQIEEYVSRNFAEALGRLFAKKMRLMIKEGDPIMVRLDGQFRQANPQAWDDEMPVAIRVGLGSGRKDQRLANWQLLIADQNALKAGGSQLVSDENMFRARDGAIRDMGLGTPSEFYTDPSTLPPQQPQPDPQMVEAQGKAALAQQQAAQDHEQQMFKLQQQAQAQEASRALDEEKARNDATLATVKTEHENALKSAQHENQAQIALLNTQAQADLAVRQQEFNEALAERKLAFEQELAKRRHDHDTELATAKVASYRQGGDLNK